MLTPEAEAGERLATKSDPQPKLWRRHCPAQCSRPL
jgi:hypothetical protein